MNYNFRKISYSTPSINPLWQYGVEARDRSLIALEKIEWWGWTPSEVQMIIDKSKALTGDEEYDYQVEGSDFLISIDKSEAHFFDMHSDKKEADIIWSFSEFIDFMEKFKKFIEENQ
ncbi:hypothetical protein [Cloacibacterium sp. TD35]|uniref:hypothetical protein n=1 Tax=Cloacibacterium sp. TD35 TaxID=2976818 RepID=UPI00237EBB77|nr:hypothetical protein [Cloacibacterium sp. TD35]WDT67886.1 hypothetical protein N7277_11225 [Cloacibacterium sp. TD35]